MRLLASFEVPDTNCSCAKVAESIANCCIDGLCRHALPGVLRRDPVSRFINVLLIRAVQCGSDDEIPVDSMETGQCDSDLILVIHHSPNRVFQRLPRPLVVEGPGHPTLQIRPRFLLCGLD